jgi:hypothetical protein
MSKTKHYKIEFYTGQVGADGKAGKISEKLDELSGQSLCPVITIGSMSYEIRDLRKLHGGSYSGVFAKYRTDDVPHAGSPNGPERPLDLSDHEGLIEKNYFLYQAGRELLIYQRNGNGSTTSKLSRYFSDLMGETVVFNPVLQPEPTRRLLRTGAIPVSVDLSIARPTNPEMFADDDWSDSILSVLAGAGGVRLKLRITSDARSKDEEDHHLLGRVKRAVSGFVEGGVAKVARVNVEEDGIRHPIDLIADRLVSSQEVEMSGRYPIGQSMNAALRRARDEETDALEEIFGANNDSLT